MSRVIKDGYERVVFNDAALWYADKQGDAVHTYCVARFPFVPDYHLCSFAEDEAVTVEYPMQTFKTLAEALAVLRVLVASTTERS